mmetsp:Transcript_9217/g.12672  ORF Transcript_9217/g.12672 Transcript_9217/m.12672 type:complete len:226 (-) Transcript_9217:1248-1925(-)
MLRMVLSASPFLASLATLFKYCLASLCAFILVATSLRPFSPGAGVLLLLAILLAFLAADLLISVVSTSMLLLVDSLRDLFLPWRLCDLARMLATALEGSRPNSVMLSSKVSKPSLACLFLVTCGLVWPDSRMCFLWKYIFFSLICFTVSCCSSVSSISSSSSASIWLAASCSLSSSSLSNSSSFCKISGSMKSAMLCPSIISGMISYLHSGFLSWYFFFHSVTLW